jgi:enoyl-CoA hydratase
VLGKISADTNARALMLTGEGDVFCAGADLKERLEHPGKDAEFRAPLLQFWHELAAFAKPLVIAVNGHAAGGGFELSLLGDAVVASDAAQFWLPEVQWGGIPGGWGTQLLPRLVGPVRARWIILNGHHISAGEMLSMGLVTHVVPQADVLDTARAIATELATRPPTAVAMAKAAIRQALNIPLSAGIEAEEKFLQQAVAAPERKAMLERFAQGHRPK